MLSSTGGLSGRRSLYDCIATCIDVMRTIVAHQYTWQDDRTNEERGKKKEGTRREALMKDNIPFGIKHLNAFLHHTS